MGLKAGGGEAEHATAGGGRDAVAGHDAACAQHAGCPAARTGTCGAGADSLKPSVHPACVHGPHNGIAS